MPSTSIDNRRIGPAPRSGRPSGIRGRPGPRGLGSVAVRHHLALALLLIGLVPVAGTIGVWSADEGALLLQATSVGSGRGWTFGHPFPGADPDGVWFPIHLSSFAADGGYVVLGKHVAFVHLTGWLFRLGDYVAVLTFSALAAVGAAAAAYRLARRIERRAALPALWLTGVASPLFLSAYVAWAHTFGAALFGWAMVGLTATDQRPRPTRLVPPIRPLLGALALSGACLVRTEAGLAAIALTMALTVSAMLGSPHQNAGRPGSWPPVLAGIATLAGLAIDRITAVANLGPVDPPDPDEIWGGLPGRLDAFSHTWLAPDFSAGPEHLLFLASAGAVVMAGVFARTRGAGDRRVIILMAAAAAAILTRFVISPVALIPGLVVAFPLLFAGLALLRRSDLARPEVGTPLLAVALYWGAVLATQYRHGGGGEWGGRYFALGLPAMVAVATPALLQALDPVPVARRRRLLALATVVGLLPVAMGLLGLRDSRSQTAAITDRVEAALADPGDGTGVPVVVTTMAPLGRWAWEDVERSRWLLVPREDMAEVGPRLRRLDVDRFLFVSTRADDELADLAPWYRPLVPFDPEAGTPLDRVIVPVRAVEN